MDKLEARAVLLEEVRRCRSFSYRQLRARMGTEDVREVFGPSGVVYQIDVQVFWDGDPEGDIRVFVAIDDGRFWAAVSPLCDSFIMTPDGSFVDENETRL